MYIIDMKKNSYRTTRILIAVYVIIIVGSALSRDATILAVAGVLTGMAFMVIARARTDIRVDEREKMMREKAAQAAYAIFAPTIGLGAFLLYLLSRGKQYFLEAIGIVLAYLTFFLMALYAISFVYYNRKFGGDGKE